MYLSDKSIHISGSRIENTQLVGLKSYPVPKHERSYINILMKRYTCTKLNTSCKSILI